jgi:hypothetical protein
MNRVIYSSGINIWEPTYLSTLCVFYDEVLLPACDEESSRDLVEFRRRVGSNTDYTLEVAALRGLRAQVRDSSDEIAVEQLFTDWQKEYEPLFNGGVLSRVPRSQQDLGSLFEEKRLKRVSDLLLDIPYTLTNDSEASEPDVIYLWQDHVFHLLREDLSLPSVFITKEKRHNRETLNGLLAFATFKVLVPKLSELHPDQILEVREKVTATREGFSMHVQALSSEVESRIQQGDSLDDIAHYARSVVETRMIPDYVEFRRQLEAQRAGFWVKVLDKASKIAEIDCAPWTPKFYAEVLKALGFTLLTGMAEREKHLTNKAQAFQFLREVERSTQA